MTRFTVAVLFTVLADIIPGGSGWIWQSLRPESSFAVSVVNEKQEHFSCVEITHICTPTPPLGVLKCARPPCKVLSTCFVSDRGTGAAFKEMMV